MMTQRTRWTAFVSAAVASFACIVTAAPAAGADDVLTLTGHGWGHGRGMGQYGAQGYALSGWGYRDILGHYYGGTAPAAIADHPISVRLIGQDGRVLVVTANAPFVVGGYEIAATRAITIEPTGDGNYRASVAVVCGGSAVYSWVLPPDDNGALVIRPAVSDPGNDLNQMVGICGGSTYRGNLRFLYGDGAMRTINIVGVEQYLRGVVPQESPSSFHAEALRAQAVAARSYALAEGGEFGNRYWYAKTCDTTSCQVYRGAGRAGTRYETATTDAAVAHTATEVRRSASGGALARTEFSSSTGGYTAGGAFPAVEDAGDSVSPYHNWTATISVAQLQSVYGIGSLQGIDIARNGLGDLGGRAVSVRVRGSLRSITRSGEQFRNDWGLRSDWFAVTLPYLVWALRASNTPGPSDVLTTYGPGDYRPVACDWDGNGSSTIGVFRDGWWYLRNTNGPGVPDVVVHFGAAGMTPVCGDWDGNGSQTIGAFANGRWYLRNSNTAGQAEAVFDYGVNGYVPVIGDWDGNGSQTVGVYVAGRWLLRNENNAGGANVVFDYGAPSYLPVVGDWDGNGSQTVGVYVAGRWLLRNANSPGGANTVFDYGAPRYLPITGSWNGPGPDTVGVVVVPTA